MATSTFATSAISAKFFCDRRLPGLFAAGTRIALTRYMSEIISFRDLVAWQRAMDLADLAYDVTDDFPARENLGLAFQIRKSAVSIPSNIAVGNRRRTPGYLYHLEIALGSQAELETQCELAFRRHFVAGSRRRHLEELIAEVGRVTHGLARSLDPTL